MKNITKQIVAAVGLGTEEDFVIVIETCSPLWSIMSLGGALSNVVNIKTFIVMGLNDGVTISFLALAGIDLAYLLISLFFGITSSLYIIEYRYSAWFHINPLGLTIYLFNMMIIVNIANMLVTTFLAVARCMCVAKPLQFKNSFTITRAVILLIGFVVFSIISYTPVLANMRMTSRFDPKVNATRISLWISSNREFVKVIVWSVVNMLLPLATQVIVIVCIVVMAN